MLFYSSWVVQSILKKERLGSHLLPICFLPLQMIKWSAVAFSPHVLFSVCFQAFTFLCSNPPSSIITGKISGSSFSHIFFIFETRNYNLTTDCAFVSVSLLKYFLLLLKPKLHKGFGRCSCSVHDFISWSHSFLVIWMFSNPIYF